ncbi:cytochrome P450 [Aspergillus tubingensis]|uniref:cytochrome P450 n=1 Tax=Aspergillus tubingensis TaxID=5068 RepID=UPI001578D22E|nr:benzoate 4-monooxygenase cytochrome P450 [Aspergillus tubingensis]GFN18246.1 benzoate 4-monooxygenase cytochrome P450 [Aspergillus tubingensis]
MESPWTQLGAFGTLAGVLLAFITRSGEIEKHLLRLFGIFTLAHIALISLAPAFLGNTSSTSEIFLRVLFLDGALFTGLFGNIVVYRLFFHRLRNVPGPVAARVSRHYAAYHTVKDAQMHYTIQRLHQQYGDVVRIGPREISVCRASAIQAIYGPPSRCIKGPWYDQITHENDKKTLFAIRDLKVHSKRRRQWDQAAKGIQCYHNFVQEQSKILIKKIREHQGRPMDVTNWINCYAFDVMGHVVLGAELGMLKTGKRIPELQIIDEGQRYVAVAGTMPWIPPLLMRIPGLSATLNPFRHRCHELFDTRRASRAKLSEPKDIISWLIQGQENGDPGAPPTEQAIKDDAWFIMSAGSDTTASALINTIYYLATHPGAQVQLQRELDERVPEGIEDLSYEKVKDLPYLTAVINETLRLKPSVLDGLVRVTPPQGLQVDKDLHLPGDVIVSVPTFAIQRDERYWEDADQFRPERWASIKNLADVPFIPFSRGSYDCVGKSIAWMEMRMALAMIVGEYHIQLADEQRAFDGKELDNFAMSVPTLWATFRPRRPSS